MLTDVSDSLASASGIAIDLRRLPWAGPLVRDYCHAFERLEAFYAGSPTGATSWSDAIARRRSQPPAPGISDVLVAQLAARGAPAEARAAAERLAEPGALAVLTGQQAGLFGGPLFTLLKALTAVRLARKLALEHDATVIPIFWVDAEDHDLDEIRSCTVLDSDLALQRVTLDLGTPPGTSAASVQLTGSIREATARLRALLPPTEFTADLITRLDAAYAEGTRLVEAFARWIDTLAGASGLVVFDASDAAAKPLVQSVFARELQGTGETARLAAAAGAELVTRGYHAQVEPSSDAVALFQLDGAREPIRVRSSGFMVGDRPVGTKSLMHEVETHPARFSPNVLLRPIVQDALFPTVAYVAGPNELAYLGQLRDVYARFGVPMPVIQPRTSATIVDAATLKFLRRYEVAFEHLQPRDDVTLNRLLASRMPNEIEHTLRDTETAMAERLASLEHAVPTIDPTLAGAVQSTKGRMERDLRNLRGKIIQAAKRRSDTLRRQFHRARAQTFPDGTPQERGISAVYFLNRYGDAFVERLLADLPLDPGQHWLLLV